MVPGFRAREHLPVGIIIDRRGLRGILTSRDYISLCLSIYLSIYLYDGAARFPWWLHAYMNSNK